MNQTIQRSTKAEFETVVAHFQAIRHRQRIYWQVRHFKFGVVLIHHNRGIGATELCKAIDILSEYIDTQQKARVAAVNLTFQALSRQHSAIHPTDNLPSTPFYDES